MKRLVIKIGSNILTSRDEGLDLARIKSICDDISGVQDIGYSVTVVSSGAIAAGMKKLGLTEKPRDIMLKQAAAAVGQSSLMWAYEKCFSAHNRKVAQLLLTSDDFSDRKRYINSRNTISTLLYYGIIPVINENDTVATDELKFGDNDYLAALVASLIEADRLVILSDVDGLFSDDPGVNPDARLIGQVVEVTPELEGIAHGTRTRVGTGGMYSKLLAAKKAMNNGITVNIINGRKTGLLLQLIKGAELGTEFRARESRLSSRKGWIALGSRAKGSIHLDKGAVGALLKGGKSLLSSGIISVSGDFDSGDVVYCIDTETNRIAKGISNYSSDEIQKVKGRKSSEIEHILGYRYSDEIIHRDNLVLL